MKFLTSKVRAVLAAGVLAVVGAGLVTSPVLADHHKSSDGMKAKVGQKAPDFTLTSVDGKSYTLSELTEDGKIVVLEWWNPKCPFVVKHHDTLSTMNDLSEKYAEKDVVWIAVNSTNSSHRDHGVDSDYIKKWDVDYPVLLDESGKVGKMYGAKTTPHMYIVDANGVLRYQGAIDSDRGPRAPRDASMVTNYVQQALDQIIAGETVTQPETQPYGCSVKYAS